MQVIFEWNRNDSIGLIKVSLFSYIFFLQNFYSPRRKYKRKDAANEDERTRVRITLLEYGDKGISPNSTGSKKSNKGAATTTKLTSENNELEDADDIPIINEVLCSTFP